MKLFNAWKVSFFALLILDAIYLAYPLLENLGQLLFTFAFVVIIFIVFGFSKVIDWFEERLSFLPGAKKESKVKEKQKKEETNELA